MSSWNNGKHEVAAWIKLNFPHGTSCLDVGACDGKWFDLLGDHLTMDAVEIYEPYINVYELYLRYRHVYCGDIADFRYPYYDIVLFGDVIEHMTVEKAQQVIDYALQHSKCVIVAVPYMFKQGPMRGNKWEEHIQDDLTPEIFDERYPGFKLIYSIPEYAYYVKDGVHHD